MDLYSMNWPTNLDFSKVKIVGAPFGGPIAICSELPMQYSSLKPTIWICTCSGKLISTIKWNSGTLLDIFWSNTEDLVCVQDDGVVLIYNFFGIFLQTFSMGDEAKTAHVSKCHIFVTESQTTGLAILTTVNHIYLVTNINEPRLKKFSVIPGSNLPPNCWCVINFKSSPKILVGKESKLYFLDLTGKCELQNLELSKSVECFLEMSVSFNNKYIALFTNSKLICIVSSDLQTIYCEFETDFITRPLQVAWCGASGVAAIWKSTLLIVGPSNHSIRFDCDMRTWLVAEFDCLRIISQLRHQILQKVAPEIEDIFKVDLLSKAAILYDAHQLYKKGNVRSEEYISSIGGEMDAAICCNIRAASQQFEPQQQKAHLSAASFGNCFLKEGHTSTEFVEVCRNLRILNCLRSSNIAIPLTYKQLLLLTHQVVFDRLIARKLYWLATQISKYLKFDDKQGIQRILAHWAFQKIDSLKDVDDESLAEIIASKFRDVAEGSSVIGKGVGGTGLSYVEIATRAYKNKKPLLAIKLLTYETRASEKVKLFLTMKRIDLAMQHAINSHQQDLIYLVLFDMKDKLQKEEFLMKMRSCKQAFILYLQYCRIENHSMLIDILYEEDDKQNEADCRVQESYEQDRLENLISMLLSAGEAYSKASNQVAAKLTEEEVRLVRLQQKLEQDLNIKFDNQSLFGTIAILIENNQQVDQIKKQFNITDKRFWQLKIEVLAKGGRWTDLEQFSKSKKSPLGYEIFVYACVRHKNIPEVQKYISKVAVDQQVKCLLNAKLEKEAVDLAINSKRIEDINLCLDQITKQGNNAQLQLIQQLQQFKK